VWLLPSPAALPSGLAAGASEVSRFSCMKFLDVSGVFDYAGLSRNSRYRSRSCCLPRITKTSASGLHLFEARSPTPPIPCLRFAGSLAVAAPDSGPGGSLLLSCKTLSFSTSCRFSPAHCYGDVSPTGTSVFAVIAALAWYIAATPRLAAAGNPGCSLASSPSGYGCDPWSTHLYVSRGIAKNGNMLTLTVVHDPDYEGNANDIRIPPGHDYYQHLRVDIPFTTAIRDFICVAFVSAPGGAALATSDQVLR